MECLECSHGRGRRFPAVVGYTVHNTPQLVENTQPKRAPLFTFTGHACVSTAMVLALSCSFPSRTGFSGVAAAAPPDRHRRQRKCGQLRLPPVGADLAGVPISGQSARMRRGEMPSSLCILVASARHTRSTCRDLVRELGDPRAQLYSPDDSVDDVTGRRKTHRTPDSGSE